MGNLRIGSLQQVFLKNNESVKQESQVEFGKVIEGAIHRVSRLEKEADRSIMDLLEGKADIHETMIALQKVDLSMKLLLAIRNKAVESYREIMRMQF